MRQAIEKIVGAEPPTCPWRAFYDPLVSEVVRVANFAEAGLAMAELGDDPYAVLLDGLHVYMRARNAGRAHFSEIERKKREKKK